jgi:Integrase core domain/HTH-like domain
VEGEPGGLWADKVWLELNRQGIRAARCITERLMRGLGLQGVRRGRAVRTTTPGKDGHRAGDLLNRDFTAPAPNRRWVADSTYVAAWGGIVYVAFVVDIYSRAIVGWAAATHKCTKLATVANWPSTAAASRTIAGRQPVWRKLGPAPPFGAFSISSSPSRSCSATLICSSTSTNPSEPCYLAAGDAKDQSAILPFRSRSWRCSSVIRVAQLGHRGLSHGSPHAQRLAEDCSGIAAGTLIADTNTAGLVIAEPPPPRLAPRAGPLPPWPASQARGHSRRLGMQHP